MKNNKKKGFTLVELLVVIAILAILASVTVVGYMGFTKKAKDSVAMQEAEQAETAIYGELMNGEEFTWKDGTTDSRTYKFTLNTTTGEITIDSTTTTGTAPTENVDKAIKNAFGLAELKGVFAYDNGNHEITYTLEPAAALTLKLK